MFVGIAVILAFGLVGARLKRHDESSLELVHVLFRHGDRTPDRAHVYKNDPYINATYYPIGFGQLTNAGKRKEYRIGRALRKRYYNFLGNFTLETVDSRCTDYNRTKTSLQLVLASLFPPRGKHVWQKKLDWQPVPFNYWPLKEDHVLGDPFKNCPSYKKAYLDYILDSSETKDLNERFADVYKYLERHTGQKLNSKSFAELYFTLTTEHENGYKMPDWATKIYPLLQYLTIADYNISTATEKLKRLASGELSLWSLGERFAGFLVKKIIEDTTAKVTGDKYTDTRVFLYSAHEVTVAFLLRFLGLFYSHVPPYDSYLSIEVHNIKRVRGFKVYYQDYTSDKPKKYKLPNCGFFCPLEKFKSLYGDLLPESEEECFSN